MRIVGDRIGDRIDIAGREVPRISRPRWIKVVNATPGRISDYKGRMGGKPLSFRRRPLGGKVGAPYRYREWHSPRCVGHCHGECSGGHG